MEGNSEETAVENPYSHDHNPLNADLHGGICSACEWERDEGGGRSEETPPPTCYVEGCDRPGHGRYGTATVNFWLCRLHAEWQDDPS